MELKRYWLEVALACAMLACVTWAEGLVVTSFGGKGELTAAGLAPGSTCRVEWASSPAGPWTNTWAVLADIPVGSNGTVAVSVPMFYRVVGSPEIGIPAGMVLIPAGTNSGTDPDFFGYSLTVEAFHMDATEVTKALWDEVRGWGLTHGYTDLPIGAGKASNHPVQTVNWYACVKWCNARSEKESRIPCYTVSNNVYRTGEYGNTTSQIVSCNFLVNGCRLPTTTEREYAARGGVSGTRFSWGDTITHSQANYESYWNQGSPIQSYDYGYEGYDWTYGASGEKPYTSPAGSFSPNGYGLYDMSGNVWEWCTSYSVASKRITRGGCWQGSAGRARCGDNAEEYLTYVQNDLGFRSVCR